MTEEEINKMLLEAENENVLSIKEIENLLLEIANS